MTYYLGRAGGLVALPDPEVGLSQSPERVGGTHQLLSGARVRDTIGRLRTWNLSWTAIDLTTFGTLQAFYYGTVGPGPYYLLDPEQRNLLIPNVSGGTDVSLSTTGWGTFGAMTLLSSTDTALTGARSLFVQWNSAMGIGAAGADTNTPITPVVGGLPYTGRFNGYFGGGTASFSVSCHLIWYDATKTFISESSGTGVIPLANWSVVATCTATAPSNAAYCAVRVTNASATTTSTSIYTDGWQLEQASSASAWVPGPGAPLVTVDALSRSTPLAGLCDAQMTLVQVG